MVTKNESDKLKKYFSLYTKVYKHGVKIFGSQKLFNKWLKSKNHFVNEKPHIKKMLTLKGLKFIDDKLTGMQYGDNA